MVIRRSRSGDNLIIEYSGSLDLLAKLGTLAKPLKTGKTRFRTAAGSDAKIPLFLRRSRFKTVQSHDGTGPGDQAYWLTTGQQERL